MTPFSKSAGFAQQASINGKKSRKARQKALAEAEYPVIGRMEIFLHSPLQASIQPRKMKTKIEDGRTINLCPAGYARGAEPWTGELAYWFGRWE